MLTSEQKTLLEEVSRHSAREAVKEVLLSLGIDYTNPVEVQRDIATLQRIRKMMDDEDTKADDAFLRSWRLSVQKVQSAGLVAIVTFIIAGLVALLSLGLHRKINGE